MEPQKITQVRKVKIIYINDPGSDKPRPVYVTATSQPNTYQILSNPVIVTSASSDGQMRYATTISSTMPISTSTTTVSNYQSQQIPLSQIQPQTFFSRPPIVHHQQHLHQQQQQQFSTARRALIPQRRIFNPSQQPSQHIRFSKLPKLPAPFDFPEIKNFVSSKILPILSADYVDNFFMELNYSPPIIEKDFNVETLECPMEAPIQETQTSKKVANINVKNIPSTQTSKTLKKPNEQRKAPGIMRKATQK
uniref:Uncharacterized protein n=1 Tax=Panagrolaimus superbus TaxID=310955 RepID=A0A914Z9R5_9BILA